MRARSARRTARSSSGIRSAASSTALDPVLRATGGTWIAHGSGTADRATVDEFDRVQIAGDEGAYTLRRVWLSRGEERGYYHGFSNTALWPLCHVAFEPPRFTRSDWRHYQDVNRRFADAVVREAGSGRSVILVHDYHLALLPGLLRERSPDSTIVMFWHIPWPNVARVAPAAVPRRAFSTACSAATSSDSRRRSTRATSSTASTANLDAAVDPRADWIGRPHGAVAVRAYPISMEWPSRWADARAVGRRLPPERAGRARHRGRRAADAVGGPSRLHQGHRRAADGDPPAAGARQRDRRPAGVRPDRGAEPHAPRALPRAWRSRAGAGRGDQRAASAPATTVPSCSSTGTSSRAEVFRFYRAADACHVNSLDDGMNLVAKEFVAARDDEPRRAGAQPVRRRRAGAHRRDPRQSRTISTASPTPWPGA